MLKSVRIKINGKKFFYQNSIRSIFVDVISMMIQMLQISTISVDHPTSDDSMNGFFHFNFLFLDFRAPSTAFMRREKCENHGNLLSSFV